MVGTVDERGQKETTAPTPSRAYKRAPLNKLLKEDSNLRIVK